MPKQLRPLTVGEAREIHERLVNMNSAEREKNQQLIRQTKAELVRLANEIDENMLLLNKQIDEALRSYQEGELLDSEE